MKTPAAPQSIAEALYAAVAAHCLPGLVQVVGGPRSRLTAGGKVLRSYVVSIRYAAIPGKWDCHETICRWPLNNESSPAAARGMVKRLLGSLKPDYLKPLVVGA